MTLQQLRYVIQVVESGSFNSAAKALFISQPSLSKAIHDLEEEMSICLFVRTNKGILLSEQGEKFLGYARQVVEQANLLEEQYKNAVPARTVFAISSQHYAFVVNAFVALVKEYNQSEYEFSLREQRTYDIIDDVKNHRSQLGILYLSLLNREVIQSILKKEHLTFTKLFEARPHVFVSKTNPLSNKKLVKMEDLENYPRLTYEQGINNSFYFSEELHSTQPSKKSIVVSDRATLFNLLIGLDGYTISSGILSTDLNGNNIVSIPLDSDEVMEIGYISDGVLSNMARNYLNHLIQYIEQTK